MERKQHYLGYIVSFFCAVILLTGLLVLAAMVPASEIRENMQKSAEYLCEGPLFDTLVDGVEGTKVDRYADSILLAIAYQYDSEQPLQSVMESSYYYTKNQNENKNLLDAVKGNLPPNQQYLRYWHGSNAIVRPLLVVFTLPQIYQLSGIVLTALAVWLLAMLLRKKAYSPAIGIVAGLVATGSWVVPFSLEYIWIYLVLFVVSILGVRFAYSGKWHRMGNLFLLSGVFTNYLDFLTAETLTLLVPLLLVIWIDHRIRRQAMGCLAVNAGKAVLLWAFGYGGMWVMKWILASVVLGENVLPYVTGHVQQRIGSGGPQYLLWAVVRNIKCLFPLEYGTVGIMAAAGLLLAMTYLGYVYRKNRINKPWIALLFVIGTVPYLRYLVLSNHAYLHFFFTYRAQMATVAAVVMILEELIEWRWLTHGTAGKTKR